MKIRKAQISELDEIMNIYETARSFMADHGNPDQWGKTEPSIEQIRDDILHEKCHVCEEEGRIEGVFYFACENDPTYAVVENGNWLNDASYHVAHRVASAGRCKGVGAFCLNWAFEQSHNLRIDTYKDNIPMQKLLKKLGFVYCGIIHLADGSPRMAFHKVL